MSNGNKNNESELAAPHGSANFEAIVQQIVDLLMEEQRAIHGEFADEQILKTGARARVKWLLDEGFAD